jgi:predicted ABC-type sugar transport system permease subunit
VASNDGTAGGAVAALTAQGMEGIPVSGQDGDHAALNRVAKGTQTVSVWKDARALGKAAGEIAAQLASGTAMADIDGASEWTSPSGTTMTAMFLAPVPITKDNLDHGCRRWLDQQGRSVPGRLRRPCTLQLRVQPQSHNREQCPHPSGWGRIFASIRKTAMTDTPPAASAPPKPRNFFSALEIDTRLLGMIGAFVVICLVFNFLTDGRFMTPRNLFNLTIQTASVAIMATGMVFVIVTRNIDLSVGSLLATCSAMMAMTQTWFVPDWLGLGLNNPATMPIAVVVGILTGLLIGAFQGWLIGYLAIPAFIVTLGGFLVWRNVAWHLTKGQTIGPLDENFQLFGGINGTLGETWSWIFAVVAIVGSLYALIQSRRTKVAHEFPVKPVWAEALIGVIIAARSSAL